jgi:predicted nuclease with TOPRIM domain
VKEKMKKIRSLEEIPEKFESLEDEAEFYDTHDFSELIKKSELKPLEIKKAVKRKYYRPNPEHEHKTG